MLYKILGLLTAVGNLGFLLVFVSAFFHIFLLGNDPNENTLAVLLNASLTLMAIGLIAMIAHLNFSNAPTSEQKATWRTRLWFGGPIAAAGYLWFVAGRQQTNGLRSRRN